MAASERPAGAGSRLGRYELVVEQAGSGTASMWIGRTDASDKLVSILRVHRHVIKKTEHVEAFLDEAQRAKPLKHENATALIDLGVNDGEVFVVLEYIEGEVLSSLVTLSGAAGLPQPVALRIARDAFAGMAAGHALPTPLVHGEFGAHQVKVGVDGKARVMGFGLSHALSRMSALGSKSNDRLAYAAPERVKAMAGPPANAPPPTDPKLDVFSCGVLLWELLAKQRLFASRIEAAIIQKVLTAPIATLASLPGIEVSPSLDKAIQRALTRDPDARMSRVEELVEAIDASAIEIASDDEVAAVVEKLAGKAIATRRQEMRDPTVKAQSGSVAPPAPTSVPASVAIPAAPKPFSRKATLMGFAMPPADDAPASAPPSSLQTPAVEPRKEMVSLSDEWVTTDDAKEESMPLSAKAPPPPKRKAAATVLGMAPLGAIEAAFGLDGKIIEPAPARAEARAKAEPPPAPHSPQPKAEPPPAPQSPLPQPKPSTPPPKRAGTLMLGSLGAPVPMTSRASEPAPPMPPSPKPPQVEKPATPKPADAKSNGVAKTEEKDRITDTPSTGSGRKRGPAASALDRVHPGSTLGRYEILMPLARGGMASVWAGRMQGTRGFSKMVAIKTMLPDISDDVDFQKMFLDEARVAARIKHPNVAEILDLGEEDDVLYLVMDWIEGDTLGALQKGAKALGGIPIPIALRIASQALGGLHAAHELRDDAGNLLDLVHRDVSPGNVLVSIQGFVKIVDFGIAKSKGRLHVTRAGGLVKGKTPYLSPEQLGQLPIDRRSDIFSFGCLLYVLTTGLHPFRGETEVKTVENIALKAPMPPRELNPSIPEDLDALILRTLEKDPAKRYATAAELQRALAAVAASLDPTSDDDVAEFVKRAIGEAQAKRAQEVKAAIAAIEVDAGRTPPPRAISIPEAAKEAAKELGVAPTVAMQAVEKPEAQASNEAAPAEPIAAAPAAEALEVAVAKEVSAEEAVPLPSSFRLPSSPPVGDSEDAPFPPRRRANLKFIVLAALGACILIGGLAVATSGGSSTAPPAPSATAAPVAAAPEPAPAPAPAATEEAAAAPTAAPTVAASAEPAPEPSATASAEAAPTGKPSAHGTQHSPNSAGRQVPAWHSAKPAAAPRPKKYNPQGI